MPAGQLADIAFRSAASAVGERVAGRRRSCRPTCSRATRCCCSCRLRPPGTPTTPGGLDPREQHRRPTCCARRSTAGRPTAPRAGTTVTVQLGAFSKNSAVLAAYTGVDPDDPIVLAGGLATDAGQTSHVTPVVTVGDHESVVSYWVDRSSAASGWTVTAPALERVEALGVRRRPALGGARRRRLAPRAGRARRDGPRPRSPSSSRGAMLVDRPEAGGALNGRPGWLRELRCAPGPWRDAPSSRLRSSA